MGKSVLSWGVVVLALLLTGCATMAGWVGIASEEHVAEQIDSVRSDIEAYQQNLAEVEQLVNTVEDTVETTRELNRLAKALERRLQELPRETIQQLVEVLQEYLDQSE